MARFLYVLLLLPLPASAKDFWNIDCGGNETYVSPPNNLTYEADGTYVRTGESHLVANLTGISRVITTVRSFPSNKKNCYTIPVEAGTKVLARVWFYYGNYDGLEKPPKFEAHYDGTKWCAPETTMDGVWRCEAIYVTKGNGTNVCVVRTNDGQTPFISGIQVRRMGSEMYGGLDYDRSALYWQDRVAYGADPAIILIRHPDDPYDRIWEPSTQGLYTPLNNSFAAVNTTGSPAHPPARVLQTAAAPANESAAILIPTPYVSKLGDLLYINMYFTEVFNLTGTSDVRSFGVYADGKAIYSRAVVPRYGEVFELGGVVNATNNTVFGLLPTNASTLPPIISAMEVYRVGTQNGLTLPGDVAALSLLQSKFQVLQNWTGDPCLPANYNWEWVRCNSNTYPRITKLYLSGFGLSGDLPDFSTLKALETVDLRGNRFSGDIPEFLNSFPNLKVLNLADNDFSSIPTWLSQNTDIVVNITGNSKLCKSDDYCFLHSKSGSPSTLPGDSSAPPPSGSNKYSPILCFYTVILFIVDMLQYY